MDKLEQAMQSEVFFFVCKITEKNMDKIKKKYTIYMRDQVDGKTRISYERLEIII